MIIYPAIDLIDGACVRLQEGDFEKQTTYNLDPFDQAQTFKAQNAEWLHIIDLSGAKTGAPFQKSLIKDIAKKTDLKIQTGGGIRTEEDVRELLNVGLDRIIIGSLAVKSPTTINNLVKEYGPKRFTIALDVNKIGPYYYVATHGWQETSDLTLSTALHIFSGLGIKNFLMTDISKDGLLSGSNIELYREFCQKFPDLSIQASGGISSLTELTPLKEAGAKGVIIGKAIYDKIFTLKEALDEVAGL